MVAASLVGPKERRLPTHSSSSKADDCVDLIEMFGRNLRTSGPCAASLAISSTVAHGNHGDARFVEDAAVEVCHFDRRSMPATDLGGEFLTEQIQLRSLGRARVRRENASGVSSPTHRSEQNQLWKLGGREPGEPLAIVNPTKCQAP